MGRRKKVIGTENIENREPNAPIETQAVDLDKAYEDAVRELKEKGIGGIIESGTESGSEPGGWTGKTAAASSGRKEKGQKVSIKNVGELIYTLHAGLAKKFNIPEVAIDKDDAIELGNAINIVDNGTLKKKVKPETWGVLNLIVIVLIIYVPIVFALLERRKENKQTKIIEAKPQFVNAVAKSSGSNTVIEPKDYMDLSG